MVAYMLREALSELLYNFTIAIIKLQIYASYALLLFLIFILMLHVKGKSLMRLIKKGEEDKGWLGKELIEANIAAYVYRYVKLNSSLLGALVRFRRKR